MRHRPWLYTTLALAVAALASCGEETTQPNSAGDREEVTAPELAVASKTWIAPEKTCGTPERTDFATATVPNAAGQSCVCHRRHSACSIRLASVMAYNAAIDTWALRAPLPWPRYAMAGAGVINGKIYVIGGYPYGYSSPRTLMYDPAKNIWAEKSRMPDVEDLQAGGTGVTGVINGKLYVVTEGRCTDTAYEPYMCGELLLRYNPVTNRWAPLALPPQDVTWTTNTYPSSDTNGMGGVIEREVYVVGQAEAKVDSRLRTGLQPVDGQESSDNHATVRPMSSMPESCT